MAFPSVRRTGDISDSVGNMDWHSNTTRSGGKTVKKTMSTFMMAQGRFLVSSVSTTEWFRPFSNSRIPEWRLSGSSIIGSSSSQIHQPIRENLAIAKRCSLGTMEVGMLRCIPSMSREVVIVSNGLSPRVLRVRTHPSAKSLAIVLLRTLKLLS